MFSKYSVADPGFPVGGGTPRSANGIDHPSFCA